MLPYFSTLRATVYVILACLFLTPSLGTIEGLPVIRFEEIVIAAFLGYAVAASLAGVPIRLAWGLRQTLLFAFVFFILISIAVGSMLGFGGEVGDLNQLIRLAKYIVMYTICVTLVRHSPDPAEEGERILRYILWLSLALFAVAVQQYFDIGGLNRHYVTMVSDVHDKTLLGFSKPRSIGMIGNPNELGYLFALCAVTATYLLTRKFQLHVLLLCLVNLFGILLTGSRTSLIAGLGGMLFFAVASFVSQRTFRLGILLQGLIVLLIVVSAGAAAFLSTTPLQERLFQRFEDLADPLSASSWQERQSRWALNLELFQESPWLGVGPLRRLDMPAVDNEWLLLLRSYGIIGTLVLVLAFLVPHWLSARTDTKFLATGVMLMSAVYMIPANLFHSLALMPVVFILLALSDTTPRRWALH